MIKDSTKDDFLRAMQEFDKEHRYTKKWRNWERRRNHKYAILHDGQLYPDTYSLMILSAKAWSVWSSAVTGLTRAGV